MTKNNSCCYISSCDETHSFSEIARRLGTGFANLAALRVPVEGTARAEFAHAQRFHCLAHVRKMRGTKPFHHAFESRGFGYGQRSFASKRNPMPDTAGFPLAPGTC